MNYTITFKQEPGQKNFFCSAGEIFDVSDVRPLVRHMDDVRCKERVHEVIGWLLENPYVLFVGDAQAYDNVMRMDDGLPVKERATYDVMHNQMQFMMNSEIKGKCAFVSGGTRFMLVRRIGWDNASVNLHFCYIRSEDLGLTSLLRKYYIDFALESL